MTIVGVLPLGWKRLKVGEFIHTDDRRLSDDRRQWLLSAFATKQKVRMGDAKFGDGSPIPYIRRRK